MEPTMNPLMAFIPYIFIFLIFYVLVIGPQRKKQKEHQQTLSNLKKNDEVVTAGGIHGVIAIVKDKTVVLRVDDNVRIEFDKESITSVAKAKADKS